MNIIEKLKKEAGGLREASNALGISYQAIWLWEQQGYIPPKRFALILKTFPKIKEAELVKAYYKRVV